MSRKYLATTLNSKKIYVDLHNSHAATHLADSPQLIELVAEFLSATNIGDDGNVYADNDMGRQVGTSDLVKTVESDDIIYAKRINRDNYTRFVRGRHAEPTSYVTVALHKKAEDEYELWSAWIGRAAPQFPGDEHETPNSEPFWKKHALVWGNQPVQPGTERTDWPW